jgi:ATP-dependent DNA helicase RecG
MRHFPYRETLQHEFKSDLRKLPLRTLLEAVVCMANGAGGSIYLGVEDNGSISGLHPDHRDLKRLEQLICHYTRPHIYVQVYPLLVDGLVIAQVQVPVSPVPIATHDGLYRRRQLQNGSGEPECVRFKPARKAKPVLMPAWPENGSEKPVRSSVAKNQCAADDPSPAP